MNGYCVVWSAPRILSWARRPEGGSGTRFLIPRPLHLKPPSAISCKPHLAEASTLRDLCEGFVPEQILQRTEEIGFVVPTDVQRQSLPLLLSGRDCVLHAQVAKVARILAAKPAGVENLHKSCTIMALLDGGMLKRHKSWLKSEPPEIVVATLGSLCEMLEKHLLRLEAMRVLIIDEVDCIFSSSKQVSALRKLLTSYSSIENRQTIFASASIPQHKHFLYDCVQQKWTKSDVIHIHVNPVHPMPAHLYHKYLICSKKERLQVLLSLLQRDAPKSAIIFVGEQSEKSKKAGNPPSMTLVTEYLKASYGGVLEILPLEEDMNFNARATSLSEVRQRGCLLVATDLASRGVDLPHTTHIYNFDLPRSSTDYLHRAGRTARLPFSKDKSGSSVTSFITHEERFVLQRFENELMFQCEELLLEPRDVLDVSSS